MANWLKDLGRSISRGLVSIGAGLSTFSICPNTDYEKLCRDLESKYKAPSPYSASGRKRPTGSEDQARLTDHHALAGDFKQVADDLGQFIGQHKGHPARRKIARAQDRR